MFFGGDDDDYLEETSSSHSQKETKDDLENFEDVEPELDLGEPPDELKEFARKHLGESPDTRPGLLQELRDVIYGEYI